METIKDVFRRAGIEAEAKDNVCKGYYQFDNNEVFVEATIEIDSYRLYFQHQEYSFELKRPEKDSVEEALQLCLKLLPSILFGCNNYVSHPLEREEQPRMPQDYHQPSKFEPPLEPIMREYHCLPEVGSGDLHGGLENPGFDSGSEIGRNHPFFEQEGRVRRDDIHPDTSRPDGLRSDLDKKYMFL